MTCSALPSQYLVEIREQLKTHVHGGKFFASDELVALCRSINTAIALAEEVEIEKDALERELRCVGRRAHPLAVVGSNVVAFPGNHPSGGSAA